MKKSLLVFVALVATILNCAYNFPEKLPAPLDIDTYTFEKVKFGQTSVNEFAYLAPNYAMPKVEGKYTIYTENNLDNVYKSLRAGFKEGFLDWVELEFAVPQSMSKFKQMYGEPDSLNSEHSDKFNYHEYKYFNVITDKNNVIVFGVTLYDESDFNKSIADVVAKMPNLTELNSIKEFIPGKLMETDFLSNYPKFPAVIDKNNPEVKTYIVPEKYLKHHNLYSSVELIFSNGLLSFVNLKPRKLGIFDIQKIYGETKENPSKKENIFYKEYFNFVVTFDKATNNVLNIGIIGVD